MSKTTETNSGASAKFKSYYIALFKEDRDWIDNTRGKQSRPKRIHEIIQKYRGEFGE